jgi:hypothetical protein
MKLEKKIDFQGERACRSESGSGANDRTGRWALSPKLHVSSTGEYVNRNYKLWAAALE